MNMLQEAFERQAGDAGAPHFDTDALVRLGEHRLHRRRRTAVLAGTVGVLVAIAIGVGIALNGPVTRSQEPADQAPTDGTKHAGTDEARPTRQVVYSDHRIGVRGQIVHFGGRAVETGNDYVHLDVTDDGFLYTDRGGVWFSDGDAPEQIGSRLCGAAPNGEFSHYANRAVMTATSGPTAAWFDCAHPASPTLVIFDTASHHEVSRRPMPLCNDFCELVDVTSDYVYFDQGVYAGWPRPDYRFDLSSKRLRATTPQEYAEDLGSHPRGLILGDDWQTGTPVTGDGRSFVEDGPLRFDAVGARLVPMVSVTDRDVATSAFDTATRRILRLRLPAGYRLDTTDSFRLFQWLDDDTVALIGGPGDILTCQLSTGRCVLAVGGPDAHTWRIVPGLPLPG